MANIISIRWVPKDALDGMQALKPLEELAYRRILDLIYVTDNNLDDDDQRMGWMTKTGKKWKTIKQELIRLNKIEIINGKITNKKCNYTLEEAHNYIAQKSFAGNASAEKRRASSTRIGSASYPPSETQKEKSNLQQSEPDYNSNPMNNIDTPSTDVSTSVPTGTPTEGQREPQRKVNQPLATNTDSDTIVSSSAAVPIKMPHFEIPPEWKRQAMLERGWPDDIASDVWAGFRDYWTTGKGRSVKRTDWAASWRTWYRKENLKLSNGGNYEPPGKSRYERTVEAFKQAIAERESGSDQGD